jgi:hypothetical protein
MVRQKEMSTFACVTSNSTSQSQLIVVNVWCERATKFCTLTDTMSEKRERMAVLADWRMSKATSHGARAAMRAATGVSK